MIRLLGAPYIVSFELVKNFVKTTAIVYTEFKVKISTMCNVKSFAIYQLASVRNFYFVHVLATPSFEIRKRGLTLD